MCSSGCPTQDHQSYGECLRSKSLQVADPTARKFRQHRDSEIREYIDARHEGMQPLTIFKRDVDFAREMTKSAGVPFRADIKTAAPTVKD